MTKPYTVTILAGMVDFRQEFNTELDAENFTQERSKSVTFAVLRENENTTPIVIYVNGVAYYPPEIDRP